MPTYVALLRAVNVGGTGKLPMADLRKLIAGLGYKNVETYIQSGNVIFRTAEADVQVLEKTILKKILFTFGFEVQVLVLTKDELRNALENNPFAADALKDSTKMHLTFLSAMPEDILWNGISPSNFAPDEFVHSGRIIYVYCPTGYGNTKLTTNFFESKLKLSATSRNLKTSTELLAIAERI